MKYTGLWHLLLVNFQAYELFLACTSYVKDPRVDFPLNFHYFGYLIQ